MASDPARGIAAGRGARIAALAAIFALGAGLRYYALTFGLPAIYNPDEIPILSRALALAKGDPNPHNFLYPTLYFYAAFAWEALYFVIARAAGIYHSVAEFQNSFFVDPSRLVLVARTMTATFGLATLAAVYRFGSRLYDRTVGLGAALLLAVAPFAVRDAHYVKLDVPTAFFVAVTYVLLSRLVTDADARGRGGLWFLAGYVAGLSMATQYYAIFVAVPFVVAAIPAERGSRALGVSTRLLVLAGAGAVAGFVTGCPFFFVELGTAMRDIAGVREVDIDRAVAGSTGGFPSAGAYLRMLLTDAVGWPVFIAAIIGIATSGWRRALLLVTFPLAFLAFVSHTVPESRYLNVLLPVVAVAGAAGIAWIVRRAGMRSTAAVGVIFAAAALPGLAGSIRSDRFFMQDDTRTLAAHYIVEHVTPGTTILVQPYSVPLNRSRESIVEALRLHLGSEDRASIKYRLQLAATPYPSPAFRLIYLGDGGLDPDRIYVSPKAFTGRDLAPLQQLGVAYVVLKRYNVPNPDLASLESALGAHATRIASVSPYRESAGAAERDSTAPFLHNTAARIEPALERPGPIVDIWQIAK